METTSIPSSPIPHLLRTNQIPSEVESQAIRETIAAAQSDISRLDADITHKQGITELLIEEREVLIKYVDDHAAFLTPARRIPADIWSEIFLHCLPHGCTGKDFLKSGATEHSVFSLGNAPALLLRVCSAWKVMALSYPKLWSFISLASDIPVPRLPGPNLVQAWLRRSHQIPLSIIVTRSSRELIPYFQRPAVLAVLEQPHRWQFLNISIPLYFLRILPLKGNVPNLEELHLGFIRAGATLSQPQDVDFFSDAPKLRRVTVHRPPPFPLVDLKLPWAQLTHFSHINFPHDQHNLCALLQSVPSLVHVQWIFTNEVDTDAMSSSTVHNPSLRDFSVLLGPNPGRTFDKLVLPSLRTLSIEATTEWDWSWLPFELFFAQSCRSLTDFTLSSYDIAGRELVACLTALPSLTHLRLSFLGYSTDVESAYEGLQQALSWTNVRGDVVMLPRMRTVEIDCDRESIPDSSLGVAQFVDMIELRWRMPLPQFPDQTDDLTGEPRGSRIESATLTVRRVRDFISSPADDDRLQRLKDEGLKVQVSLKKTGKKIKHLV